MPGYIQATYNQTANNEFIETPISNNLGCLASASPLY